MGRKLIIRSPTAIDAEKPVNLRTLAGYVGLSLAAVSRILNDSPAARAIPAETRQRVIDAAKKFNYKPNVFARSLRSRRSYTIGVMVSEVSEGYATLLLSGIEQKLMEEGYFYFVVSHHHRPELLRECEELMMARGIDGIVAIDTKLTRTPSVPTVTISGHDEPMGVTNILLDHRGAAALAIGHLCELGHDRIALMRGQSHTSDSDHRWSSITDRMRELGRTVYPELVMELQGDDPTAEPAYQATHRLLEQTTDFTAVFAFNDVSAIGAVHAIVERGLRVPEDISVIGFDDIQTAAYLNPALTTIRQPLKQMGCLAAENVLRMIQAGDDAASSVRQLVIEPELIVRGSTTRR